MDEAAEGKRQADLDLREERMMEEIELLRRINEDTQQKIDEMLGARGARDDVEESYRNAEKLIKAKQDALSRSLLITRLRAILFFLGALMTILASILLAKPAVLLLLFDNPTAITLVATGSVTLFAAILLGVFNASRERTFVDIDDKLYSARVVDVESERDELMSKVRELERELNSNFPAGNVASINASNDDELIRPERLESIGLQSVSESKSFDVYMRSVIRALDLNIEIADNKASLLLDKGTNYLWRGIAFYIASIIVWQVVTANFKVGDYAVWGMISCSMTFLVVEFLAAWFLRQYKSFTDSSFNLVRVKSIFNRYFLSYLAIKEFSDSSQHLVDMRSQMLKVLEEDIKWLEPAAQKVGEMNHMIAMFESVSGLVEKLKSNSKEDKAAKPS